MLEGEISQIQLIERLVELWREQFTGAIRFENDGIIKIIYFKGGDILSASTNDRADSIDEILMRAGKVSRDHVKQALAKRKENETLGDALLNLGFITRKELTWARRVQVVGVIRSIAAWTDGSFTIVADYLPKRDEGTLFPLPQVLVELIVTEQDRARFERALDGGQVVFRKTGDFDEVWRRLGLNEDAEAIVRQIDGTKDAAAVATASDRDTFNVYKLLHALATLGVLGRVEKPKADPEFSLDDFASAGVADAADLWNDPVPVVALDDTPQFELDETEAFAQPTLEIPKIDMPDEVAPAPIEDETLPMATPITASAWDEPDDDQPLGAFETEPEPVVTPAAPEAMPSWDAPPRDAVSIPVQTAVEPPAEAEEEAGWGFDEAQIETARRATVEPVAAAPIAAAATVPSPKARKRGGRGILLALLLLLILGAAGWYGWQWLQNRDAGQPAVATTQPGAAPMATTPPPANTPATETAEPLPPVTTGVTTTAPGPVVIAPPTTLTIAPGPPAAATATSASTPAPVRTPAVITPAAPAPDQALPRVTARTPAAGGAGRERIDSMAREYAANATGNFTVQIQILCDPANVEKAMRAGGDRVWFVPQTIGGRSCYRVFWGRFGTRDEAQRGLGEVPAGLRDRNSAVRAVPK